MNLDDVVAALRAAGCVWAEEEAGILVENSSSDDDLVQKVARRAAGEPLELVVGWAEFRGLRLHVEPHVFVPRRRTEFLAEQAIQAAEATAEPVVVELCCGAGAISAAILNETKAPVELHAADIDPAAVEVARQNLTDAHLYVGDLFSPLPQRLRGRVHVLVANVPYVPTEDLPLLPPESRSHEPGRAVDGGTDGLRLFGRLVTEATRWLAPSGCLMSEVSEQQAPLAASLIERCGLLASTAADENLGATVVIGASTP